jgi:hypothetical protein
MTTKDCSICLEEKCDACKIYADITFLDESLKKISPQEQMYVLNSLKSTAASIKFFKLRVELGYN